MIYLMGLVFISVAGYLLFLVLDLRRIIQQLTYIVDQETNAELVSTSKNPLVRRLLDDNNQLIRKNKKYYQEQKQKEKQLQQLLSNLSHDLKTPLTVSSGYLQLLLKDPELEGKQEILRKIEHSLSSISQYVNELMEYNLIQEKNIQLELEKINMSELLKENLFTYYDQFQKAALVVSTAIEEDVYVIADRTVLQRICENGLGNIVKYGHDFVEISLTQQEEIVISMKNGLKEQIQQPNQLFQRFTTKDTSRTNKSIGLGLNIIQELAELSSGRVELEASTDTFELTIYLNI